MKRVLLDSGFYVRITEKAEAEMTPRINLTATGWAIRASNISVSGVEFTSNVNLNNYNPEIYNNQKFLALQILKSVEEFEDLTTDGNGKNG